MIFSPRYLPCARCGACIDAYETRAHVCTPERLIEFRLFAARHETAAFADDLAAWSATRLGSFERFLAARQVRAD